MKATEQCHDFKLFDGMHNREAKIFVDALRKLASNEDNLDNLQSYLSHHFGAWLERYANSPGALAVELKGFAEMDIYN